MGRRLTLHLVLEIKIKNTAYSKSLRRQRKVCFQNIFRFSNFFNFRFRIFRRRRGRGPDSGWHTVGTVADGSPVVFFAKFFTNFGRILKRSLQGSWWWRWQNLFRAENSEKYFRFSGLQPLAELFGDGDFGTINRFGADGFRQTGGHQNEDEQLVTHFRVSCNAVKRLKNDTLSVNTWIFISVGFIWCELMQGLLPTKGK